MGKQIRKGRTISPRKTFPISGIISGESLLNLTTVKNRVDEAEMRKLSAIRRPARRMV